MSKVHIVKSILSDSLIDEIEGSIDPYSHTSNLTSWPNSVVGSSGAILVFGVNDEFKDRLCEEITKKTNVDIDRERANFAIHFGSFLSFIPVHDDHIYELAMTIYINREWKTDWGGAFLYEDGEEGMRAIFPEYNKCVFFEPPLVHCTTMPTINAPLRKSIQIFTGKTG